MSRIETKALQSAWILSIPLLALSLRSEWRDFFTLWNDSLVYNHGYLVLAGTCFLLLYRRKFLRTLNVEGSALALTLLAGCSLMLVVAQAADIRVIRLLLVPVMVVLWGCSIWGIRFVRFAGGPIMMLVFAVPIWDDLSPALQHITVFFNNGLLSSANIEATINEFLIILEVGTFHVENGCSGVRYLMVAMFLAAFYGQLFYSDLRSKTLLILFAALLSMVSNWIRVFGIILAGHYTNMETSLVEDHELFGWGVFVVITLIPLFFLATKMEDPSQPATADKSTQAKIEDQETSGFWPVLASLLLIWPSLLPVALETKTEEVAANWNPGLVEPSDGWKGPIPHAKMWSPEYKAPDFELSGVYVSEDFRQVQLQITGYRRQLQEKELIFFRNKLFDPEDWILLTSNKRLIGEFQPNTPPTVNETVIRHRQDGSELIIWSWFEIGGYLTDSRLEAKIAGAFKKLSGDSRGALWAIAGPCEGKGDQASCARQRATFERFLNTMLE